MNKLLHLFSAVACPLLALLLLVGAAGCRFGSYVTIECEQPGATVSEYGERPLGEAPVEIDTAFIKAFPLDPGKYIYVSKPGYATKKVKVAIDSPKRIIVSLDRLFHIDSIPRDADIYVNGKMVGTTPAQDIAVDESGSSAVEIRKKGWLPASLKITRDTPFNISLTMEQDGPGRRLPELIPTSDGVRVDLRPVFSDNYIGEQYTPNTATCTRLTNQPENECILGFSLLPDGKTIAASILEEYTKNDRTDYRANIFRLDTSIPGAPRKAVTGGDYFDLQPTPSSDGETLYFSSSRNGRLGVWTLRMNENGPLRTVTAGNTADCSPALKPETDHLFYTAVLPDESASAYIWKRPLDGGMPEQLTEGYDSQWSPDGTKLLYIKGSLKDNKARIRVCDPDGNNAVQISPDDGEFNDIDARWSPDGKKIVFASDRSLLKGERNFDIYIMDADGGNLTQLTSNACRDDKPVFAPDGKTVFFRSNRGLAWDIWALELKTGGQ